MNNILDLKRHAFTETLPINAKLLKEFGAIPVSEYTSERTPFI